MRPRTLSPLWVLSEIELASRVDAVLRRAGLEQLPLDKSEALTTLVRADVQLVLTLDAPQLLDELRWWRMA